MSITFFLSFFDLGLEPRDFLFTFLRDRIYVFLSFGVQAPFAEVRFLSLSLEELPGSRRISSFQILFAGLFTCFERSSNRCRTLPVKLDALCPFFVQVQLALLHRIHAFRSPAQMQGY